MNKLAVHFDDSGTHIDSPVAVVAGWVAPIEQWNRFTRDWNKARSEYGFDVFHMAEFMANNPKSEYSDKNEWDSTKKKIVFNRLASIARERAHWGFSMRVDKSDYDSEVPKDKRKILGEFHYTYAVRAVIGWIENYRVKAGIEEPIEYIFDRMTKGKAKTEIEQVFEEAEQNDNIFHRTGIYKGCHSFRDKAEILPLQAADMLAWLSQRAYAFEKLSASMPKYAFDEYNRLVKAENTYLKSQTREQLRDFIASNPHQLVTLPDNWKPRRSS